MAVDYVGYHLEIQRILGKVIPVDHFSSQSFSGAIEIKNWVRSQHNELVEGMKNLEWILIDGF